MNGTFLKTVALAAAAAVSLSAVEAAAQTICGKRSDIVRQLKKKYGETRRSVGFQRGRGIVEVFASAKTGSWTILITNRRGLSCLMATGSRFELDKVAKAETNI